MNLIRLRRPRYMSDSFQEQMNRMIEDAFEDLGLIESRQKEGMAWKPAIELNELDGSYQLKAELPGVKKDDVVVEISENEIKICAESKQKEEEKKENTYRSELRYGKFLRTVALPSDVDSSKAKAEYNDGILTITVPKSEEENKKMRKLNIE